MVEAVKKTLDAIERALASDWIVPVCAGLLAARYGLGFYEFLLFTILAVNINSRLIPPTPKPVQQDLLKGAAA